MKKYKITESQYNRLIKEIGGDEREPISTIINREKDLEDEPLTQEEIQLKEFKELKERVNFLEDFFRDIVDFTEVSTHSIDDAFNEISDGKVGILRVKEKLNLLTSRKGRSTFYIAKRGLGAS